MPRMWQDWNSREYLSPKPLSFVPDKTTASGIMGNAPRRCQGYQDIIPVHKMGKRSVQTSNSHTGTKLSSWYMAYDP